MIYFIFQDIFEGKTQRASQKRSQKYFVIRFFLMTLVIFIFFFRSYFYSLKHKYRWAIQKDFSKQVCSKLFWICQVSHLSVKRNWKWKLKMNFFKNFFYNNIHTYIFECLQNASFLKLKRHITLTFEFWSRYVISSQISNDFFYFKVLVGVNRNLGYKSYFSPKKFGNL